MKSLRCILAFLVIALVSSTDRTYQFDFSQLGRYDDATVLKEYLYSDGDRVILELEYAFDSGYDWFYDEAGSTAGLVVTFANHTGSSGNPDVNGQAKYYIECLDYLNCEQQRANFVYDYTQNEVLDGTQYYIEVQINNQVVSSGLLLGLCNLLFFLLAMI